MPEQLVCCICHRMCHDTIGNNPSPVYEDTHESGRCCNDCNRLLVIPMRIAAMRKLPAKIDLRELRRYMKPVDRRKAVDNIRHKLKGYK